MYVMYSKGYMGTKWAVFFWSQMVPVYNDYLFDEIYYLWFIQ